MDQNNQPVGAERKLERVAVNIAVRLGFIGVLAWWALTLVSPFIVVVVVVWAVILAVALDPIYDWTKRKLGGRGWIAALIITLTGLAVLIGPTTLLATSVIGSVDALASDFVAGTLKLPQPPVGLKE
jgi:predicted PurR-regulated permease PerM